MTTKEANAIIAKFMGRAGYKKIPVNIKPSELLGESFGYTWDISEVPIDFSESFDSLFPVWEKLNEKRSSYDQLEFSMSKTGFTISMTTPAGFGTHTKVFSTLSGGNKKEIAAIATAKTILELQNV